MPLKLHNTLSRRTETFEPQNDDTVLLYTCGPTVYDSLHIGNWTSYIRWDELVRVLHADGYSVKRVMNITDVGHLTSDGDEGEDKLEKGARREGKSAWDVARMYTDDFLNGMKELNLIMPEHLAKATEFIPQQLELLRTLTEKGYTYQISDGIYFDTAKFPSYGDFAHLNLDELKAGARVEYNSEKRSPSDFALWKFTPNDQTRDMQWQTPEDLVDSNPSGEGAASTNTQLPTIKMGFPGWHLECSAIAMSLLGETLDIHTGGIDHIPVHHTNEIAQSEAATGKLFSRFWLHANFMTINGTKISKSLGNGYTLHDVEDKGFSPMDFRMLVLQSHYSTEANFTWESLQSAHQRLLHWKQLAELRHQLHSSGGDQPSRTVRGLLLEALNNDLDTPAALKLIDETISNIEALETSQLSGKAIEALFEDIDELLGFTIISDTPDITDEQKQLILERERAREASNYKRSDEIREELAHEGISLRDVVNDTIWYHET